MTPPHAPNCPHVKVTEDGVFLLMNGTEFGTSFPGVARDCCAALERWAWIEESEFRHRNMPRRSIDYDDVIEAEAISREWQDWGNSRCRY